jgi:hypothetical protein
MYVYEKAIKWALNPLKKPLLSLFYDPNRYHFKERLQNQN